MTLSRIRIKMCGMTRQEDIAAAAALGADAVGFILYPKSKRFITFKQANELSHSLPLFMSAVAVVVNPDAELVRAIIEKLPVRYLQFHGDEPPEFCDQFAFPYIKAIPAVSRDAIVNAAKDYAGAAAILLDTPCDARGGSGKAFDWRIIPPSIDKAIMVAGGLNSDNIRDAINVYRPYAVDVCSGIEATSGIKDHHKMKLFVQALGDI